MGFLFFLIIALVAVFSAHFFIYFTIVRFFVLSSSVKAGLAVIITLLSVSFILSMLLVHWKETAVTRVVYYSASVWLGIFVNVVLLLAMFWLVYAVFQWMGIPLPWKLVLVVAGGVALLVSAWGMYNAHHPRFVNHTLKISELPEVWRGKKIVHLSDLHLGLSHGVSFLERVVAMTEGQQPDIILITGDLFDGGKGQLEQFLPELNRLWAPQGVYFVTGNHETYVGLEEVRNVLLKTKIKFLDDEVVQVDGLNVIGISYPQRGTEKDIPSVIHTLARDDQPQILLFHAPVFLNVFAQAGMDAMFSGHTHQGQLFPFGFVTRVMYQGYDRGLQTVGDMQLNVSSGTGTWGPPMKTSGRTEIGVFVLE